MNDLGEDDLDAFGRDNSSDFVAAASLVLDSVSGTRFTGHIDLGPQHHTPWGVVHGGVFTSAVETAASIGASATVRPGAWSELGAGGALGSVVMEARGRSITASAVMEVGGWTTAAEENVVDQFLAAWLLRE